MELDQITTNKDEEHGLNDRDKSDVSRVLSFEEFKKSLGPSANKYTNEQIENMRIVCDKIADIIFDSWLNKRNAA